MGFGKDVVDPILLKRVEVLKGPSSALYGSDGLAGTVSYMTKDPSDLASSGNPFISVGIGSASVNQLSKISALTAIVAGNMEALVQVTTREVKELEIHNDSTSPLNPMEGDGLSLLAKLKLNMTNGSDLTLTIDNQETDAKYELLNEIGTSYFPQAEEVTASIGDDNSTRERVTLSYNFESGNALFDSGELRLFSQTTGDPRRAHRDPGRAHRDPRRAHRGSWPGPSRCWPGPSRCWAGPIEMLGRAHRDPGPGPSRCWPGPSRSSPGPSRS